MKHFFVFAILLAFCATMTAQPTAQPTGTTKDGKATTQAAPQLPTADVAPALPPHTSGTVYFVRDTVPNVLLVSNATGPTVWQLGGFSIVEANTLDPELKRLSQFATVGYLDAAKQPLAKDIIIWSERLVQPAKE